VAGNPVLTVRFEAPDDATAVAIGRSVVVRVESLAEVEASRVRRRYGARWYPVR
jgi:hypothetical protein